MSQRASVPGPAASSTRDDPSISPRSTTAPAPSQSRPAQGQAQERSQETGDRRARAPGDGTPSVTVSPAAQASSSNAASFSQQRPSRLIGVHSILNPTNPEVPEVAGRRRSAAHFDTSPFEAASRRQSLPANDPASIAREPGPERTPPSAVAFPAGTGQAPRRILTPLSPAARRTASLGRVHVPLATIDARNSPFLSPKSSRNLTAETGSARSEMPRVPSPPSRPTFHYSLPSVASGPLHIRRESGGAPPGLLSQSASPSTSYSSFSQASIASPAPQHGFLPLQPGLSFSAPGSGESHGHGENRFGASGQGNIQLMTLETDQGPIQVPVDVQAASKVADEKRRRNAGASARFRQRRKEKERESSQTIAKLEQRLRDSAEDTEFYRRERDYFRQLLLSLPGQGQIAPRPPSPRLRRSSVTPTTSSVGRQWQEADELDEMEMNVRRSTSAYSYSFPPASVGSMPSLSQPYGPLTPLQPPTENRPSPNSLPPMPSGPPPPSRGSGPFDPYGAERYGRAWPPNRGPR
ncbi:MAG: hypothetical protein M1819_003404 [Sarea resinae]|nr:MAG: hypothetical protein M1819_003404 [Sarea resinae]